MSEKNANRVTAVLREYAEKMAKQAASAGAPDRMTTADGQGGITTSQASPKKDPGEGDVKADMPANGTKNEAASIPAGAPDRLTTADGQGGITASSASSTKDPGEDEVKKDMPADGTMRVSSKSASDRVARIRATLMNANPALAEKVKAAETANAATKTAKTAGAAAAAHTTEGEGKISYSQETLAKIASAVLSTEEGFSFVQDVLEKQAGEAAAREQILEAIEAANAYDQSEQIKAAAYHGAVTDAEQIHDELYAAGVTEEDADAILKQAALHQDRINSYDHPLLKQAYATGVDDAAMLAAADEAAGAEGVPPVDEALPMGGEDLSEEEILALLQEMIASGEISEEDIMAALDAEGGGMAEEPAPEEMAAV